jgi:transcriptional regulator with XRE-family HTH domain
MSLGSRIKERLRELGISQAELARRAKVPQTTINGLIQGNSRTTPHLIRIAEELSVTPAYLTGEAGDIYSEKREFEFNGLERDYIKNLRCLPKKDREIVLRILKVLCESQDSSGIARRNSSRLTNS